MLTCYCESSSRFLPLMVAAVLMLPSGCSDAGGYTPPVTLVGVTGQILLDGTPLSGATVNFLPAAGTSGTGGFAVTDVAGQFKALHYSMAEGLEPGTYHLTFSRLLMPDGSPLPEGQDAADVGAVESLPHHLTTVRAGAHPYRLTVDAAPQDVTFELESKAKR